MTSVGSSIKGGYDRAPEIQAFCLSVSRGWRDEVSCSIEIAKCLMSASSAWVGCGKTGDFGSEVCDVRSVYPVGDRAARKGQLNPGPRV